MTTRYHASSPTTPTYYMHVAMHPECGRQVGWGKRKEAERHFQDTGMAINVTECTCDDVCRCEGE